MSKVISAFATALIGSIIFTFFNMMNRNTETTLYYTGISLFMTGFVVLFFLFLFIATPMSLFLDKKIKHYTFLTKSLLYFVTGIAFGALFLIFNPSNNLTGILNLLLISGCSNLLFFLFSHLTDSILLSYKKLK
ncbi:hypothetical protein [Paenibacillus sp. FSL R7-0272]|uniref:hypothetical protein n=1 Tax=Paenibacillus sp. FSL R7-0272 TaxID=2921679 RepID=UPI0030EF9550